MSADASVALVCSRAEILALGAVLAELRQARGLSQKQAAHSAGLSQSTLSRVERGESALGFGEAEALAATLRVEVRHFADLRRDVLRSMGRLMGALVADGLAVPSLQQCDALAVAAARAVVASWLGRA